MKFTSETTWAWTFSFWKDFVNKVNYFNRCSVIHIIYFLSRFWYVVSFGNTFTHHHILIFYIKLFTVLSYCSLISMVLIALFKLLISITYIISLFFFFFINLAIILSILLILSKSQFGTLLSFSIVDFNFIDFCSLLFLSF